MEKDIYILYKGTRFKRIQEDCLISEDESQVMFNGYLYTWNGKYYRAGIYKSRVDGQRIGFSMLSRHIWTHNKGKIPSGFIIHHVDGNARNNAITNLDCIDEKIHRRNHSSAPGSWPKSEACKESLRNLNAKACAWHKSPEGLAWHKMHGEKLKGSKKEPKFKKNCFQCGKEFYAKQAAGRFCCAVCKNKARYLSGIDDINRKCSICENSFMVNKYSSKKTCSKECSVISSRYTKRGIRFNS